MTRCRLPNRRDNQTTDIVWQDQQIAACIGLDSERRPAEIFARLKKPGSDFDLILDDIGVLLSLLLQYGVTPEQLAYSVGRADGKPASVVGALVDLLARDGAEEKRIRKKNEGRARSIPPLTTSEPPKARAGGSPKPRRKSRPENSPARER